MALRGVLCHIRRIVGRLQSQNLGNGFASSYWSSFYHESNPQLYCLLPKCPVTFPSLNYNFGKNVRFQECDDAELPLVNVQIAKKLMRLAQIDILKQRLQEFHRDCISRKELMQISEDSVGMEDAEETIKILDESGFIFIIGDNVFLRSSTMLNKALQRVKPILMEYGKEREGLEELRRMEKEKRVIDEEAERRARMELWCGLGVLVVTSAALMRLTFWELSWEVMEPICFFLTHSCVLAGFAFYLKTSRVPSIDGVFRARVNSRRNKLIHLRNFDTQRFNHLKTSLTPRFLHH